MNEAALLFAHKAYACPAANPDATVTSGAVNLVVETAVIFVVGKPAECSSRKVPDVRKDGEARISTGWNIGEARAPVAE